MNKLLSLIIAAGIALSLSAATDTYYTLDLSQGKLPASTRTADLDGSELHFLMKQAGFTQGDAWIVKEAAGATCAASPGWNKDGKTPANKWLILPPTLMRANEVTLSYSITSINDQSTKPSTYRILLSEGDSPIENPSTTTTELFAGEAPVDTWTPQTLTISGYKGKHINIAIINTSLKGEILALKDLKIEGDPGIASIQYLPGKYNFGDQGLRPGIQVTATDPLTPITSIQMTVNINGQTTNTQQNLNLTAGQTHTLLTPQAYNTTLGQAINYTITATINDQTYDPVEQTTTTLSFLPKRRILLEECTGMWCGWCPLGIIATDSLIAEFNDQIIPVAVHTNDLLAVPGYDQFLGKVGMAPNGFFNRTIWNDNPLNKIKVKGIEKYALRPGGFGSTMDQLINQLPEAEINVTMSLAGATYIKFDTQVRFAITPPHTNYRLGILLIENDLWGKEFYQTNYLAGAIAAGPLAGYEYLPQVITTNYKFQHVARGWYSNLPEGIPNSLPKELKAGETYKYSNAFSIISSSVNRNNCGIVAILIDGNTNQIVNAAVHYLNPPHSAIPEIPAEPTNPTSSLPTYNLQGQRIENPQKGLYIRAGRIIKL